MSLHGLPQNLTQICSIRTEEDKSRAQMKEEEKEKVVRLISVRAKKTKEDIKRKRKK